MQQRHFNTPYENNDKEEDSVYENIYSKEQWLSLTGKCT